MYHFKYHFQCQDKCQKSLTEQCLDKLILYSGPSFLKNPKTVELMGVSLKTVAILEIIAKLICAGFVIFIVFSGTGELLGFYKTRNKYLKNGYVDVTMWEFTLFFFISLYLLIVYLSIRDKILDQMVFNIILIFFIFYINIFLTHYTNMKAIMFIAIIAFALAPLYAVILTLIFITFIMICFKGGDWTTLLCSIYILGIIALTINKRVQDIYNKFSQIDENLKTKIIEKISMIVPMVFLIIFYKNITLVSLYLSMIFLILISGETIKEIKNLDKFFGIIFVYILLISSLIFRLMLPISENNQKFIMFSNCLILGLIAVIKISLEIPYTKIQVKNKQPILLVLILGIFGFLMHQTYYAVEKLTFQNRNF